MLKTPVLIIGGNGQIGSELGTYLSKTIGEDELIISDIKKSKSFSGRFVSLDILDYESLKNTIHSYKIKTVVNLAAVLSAIGESNPGLAWKVNVDGLLNLLNLAVELDFSIFHPSSIAVFGIEGDKKMISQNHQLLPKTIYGASKVAGEALCNYYYDKYGVDVRSTRLPGVISAYSMPGGGTTDYAVDIYHQAILNKSYTCFLKEDTTLPMIFMDDVIDAIINIMNAPSESLSIRYGYNINGLSINPRNIGASIREHIPDFDLNYDVDYRQEIAHYWPESVDDSAAKKDWKWQPKIELKEMTQIMVDALSNK